MRDTAAMIAGMAPVADGVTWHFCTTADAELAARARPTALASFAEAEGMSLVLSEKEAVALGFDTDLPMARITLTVQSALDGVGLTAAVATALATALAGEGIPCNMVAGYHHDHVFVPVAQAERALEVLRRLACGEMDG
ncbi:MAG: ACT domain-containing protein [Roseovarius sp.]|uniref:ACT domain-containing protein n=1 Tax=Marinovum algicola TaxID=42444 RepID=UPI0032EBCD37